MKIFYLYCLSLFIIVQYTESFRRAQKMTMLDFKKSKRTFYKKARTILSYCDTF